MLYYLSRVIYKACHTVEAQYILDPLLLCSLSKLLITNLGLTSGLALEFNSANRDMAHCLSLHVSNVCRDLFVTHLSFCCRNRQGNLASGCQNQPLCF